MSSDIDKTRYTHRDYESIKSDLIELIPSLTQEWTSRNESDPGIVLIKLMSIVSDNLSFNMDKMALELYLSTVTQRKNCAKILQLLGYKMHWYRTTTLQVYTQLPSGQTSQISLIPFQSNIKLNDLTFTVVRTPLTYSNQGSVGSTTYVSPISVGTTPKLVEFVEGKCNEVTFEEKDLVNNRYYLNYSNIDENHLYLTYDNENNRAMLVENLAEEFSDEGYIMFSFNVDEYDNPYIELRDDWKNGASGERSITSFKLRYVITKGKEGNVSTSSSSIDVRVNSAGEGSASNKTINIIYRDSIESPNIEGKDPDDITAARKDAYKWVRTYKTLVTAEDFKKATLRTEGVDIAQVVDAQVVMDWFSQDESKAKRMINELVNREDNNDFSLAGYQAITYYGYKNYEMSNNEFYDEATYYSYDEDEYGGTPSPLVVSRKYYPYKAQSTIETSILNEEYRGTKVINVQMFFGTTKVYPFKVKGILYLTEPQLPSVVLQIIDVIDEKLEMYYSAENQTYYNKPNFMDIVNVISNSHPKVKYFDADSELVKYDSSCYNETGSIDKYPVISGYYNSGTFYKDEQHTIVITPDPDDRYIIYEDITDPENVRYYQYNGSSYIANTLRLDVGFDQTSYAMYIGLHKDFNLAEEFLTYKIYNSGGREYTLDTGYQIIIVDALSYKVVSVESKEELKVLNDLVEDSSGILTFVKYDK